jgi:hypothetical protein
MNCNTNKLLIVIFLCFFFLSCDHINNEVDNKLKELKTKTESLDSLINEEVDKVMALDSIINTESEKVKQLDSVINQNTSKIDSVVNEKIKIFNKK